MIPDVETRTLPAGVGIGSRRAWIDSKPRCQPDESQQPGERKSKTPTDLQCDPRNRHRRDCSADTRTAVENGHRDTSLFRRKMFRDSFAGARPVKAFADPEQKPQCTEGE